MQFANFEFEPETHRLGEGPQSEVFRAVDTRLGRTVALKILRPHIEFDPDAVKRFEREAKHTSALEHPNIATIYEYGQDRGTSYIAMEFLEGSALDKIVAERTLGYDEGLRVGLQVSAALELVHRRGLIHRDLKPANIMVLPDGTVKLLDFGICRSTGESNITQDGMLVGTVLYMSPEQVRGQELDIRSDVFAFGSVLYHALTGQLPFAGKTFPEVCMAILDGQVRPPSELRQSFPKVLESLLLKCLSPEPGDRFSNGGAIHDALLSAAQEMKASTGTLAQAELRGELLLTPVLSDLANDHAQAFASGLRRDLAAELERSSELVIDLPDHVDPTGPKGVFILRARLDLAGSKGKVEYDLERIGAEDQATTGFVEHEDADEWGLQAQLVRSLARAVRRGIRDQAEASLAVPPKDPERALALARAAHATLHRGTSKHLMSSISTFRRAIEDDSACALAYAGLAEAMVRKFLYWDGDRSFLREAVEHGRKALSIDPNCAEAHTSLGFAHSMSGSPDDALREYRLAIQEDNDEWLAHRFMGALQARLGNYKAAAPLLRRAVALRPTHIGSYDHWYNALTRLDQYEAALTVAEDGIQAAQDYLRKVPDDQEARLHLALLLARLGSIDDARETAEEALTRASKDGYTLFHVGCVLAICGDSEDALQALEEAQSRGYYVRSELWTNTDLDGLRELPRFQELAG